MPPPSITARQHTGVTNSPSNTGPVNSPNNTDPVIPPLAVVARTKTVELFNNTQSISKALLLKNNLLYAGNRTIFPEFAQVIFGILQHWHLISNHGFEYLHELSHNTSFVLTEFMNLLCNYSGQLSEVTGATLAGANYKTWNDIHYLQTKLDDWYLFISVLRFAREKDSREREKLEKIITRSARKSRENNIQIAKDFVAQLPNNSGSDPDVDPDSDYPVDASKPSPAVQSLKSGSEITLSNSEALPETTRDIHQKLKSILTIFRSVRSVDLPTIPPLCPVANIGTLNLGEALFVDALSHQKHIGQWIQIWPEPPDFNTLRFTKASLCKATTSYHVFRFWPDPRPGYEKWFCTKYTHRSHPKAEWRKLLVCWKSTPSSTQRQLVDTLMARIDRTDPHKALYHWSCHSIAPLKDEMIVFLKKTLRDDSQMKEGFIQAWSPPKPAPTFSPKPAPHFSPTPANKTPIYTKEPHFKILPDWENPARELVVSWTKLEG